MMPVMPFWAKFAHDGRTVNDEGADNVANAPRIADDGNKVNYDSAANAANAANAATNARTDYNVSSPNGARAAIDGSVANPACLCCQCCKLYQC